MAILKLTNGDDPKVAISLNTAMQKKGVEKPFDPKTVLGNAIRDAGIVAGYNKNKKEHSVTLAVKDAKGNYTNYFVDQFEKDGSKHISLTNATNENEKIYANFKQVDGKPGFYAIDWKLDAAKKLLDGASTRSFKDKNYMNVSALLQNKEIKQEMQKNSDKIAILSSEGLKFKTKEKTKTHPPKEKKSPTKTR
jgi:hypothetical protein